MNTALHRKERYRIFADNPTYEMLSAYHEENLLHQTKESEAAEKSTTRHLPMDCKKWDCSVCYSLMHFNEPIKYAKFLGC